MIKKSTLIAIGCFFIFSVVIVSFFGMKAVVYNPFVPIESIECTNISDEKKGIKVSKDETTGKITIEVDRAKAYNTDEACAILLIEQVVFPVDATNKDIRYVYDKEKTSYKFEKNPINGKENGKILIYSKTYFSFEIKSTDGTTASVSIDVWAK